MLEDILSNPFIIRAIIAIILIAIVSATMGSFTVFRGQTFMTAGVSHAALAGASLGILIQMYYLPSFDPMLGAALFAILMALATAYASKHGDASKTDVMIGVSFAFALGIAVLLISAIKEYAVRAWGLLIGDLLLLTDQDILLLFITTLVIVVFTIAFFTKFILISFDPEGAEAHGIRTSLYNNLLLILVALSIIVVLKGIGALLVYALMIGPGATANEILNSVMSVMAAAFFIALLGGFMGLIISFYVPISPGAIAAILTTIFYFFVQPFSKK